MKKILLFPLIALLALPIAACEKKSDLLKLRLNETVHSIFYAPQYVALEKGFFKAEGLDVTVDVAQGSDKCMTALIAGEADVALLGPETGIYIYNEGRADYAVIFAQLTKRAGNFLVSRNQEANFSWKNVLGKTIIGGRPGGMPEMILEYILKQNNIEPFVDVEIINNLQFTSTAGAFVAGNGDYTVEFEPSATAIENQGNGYVVASLGADSGTVPYTVYMATRKYLADNKETIQKFTNAVYRGELWVKEHSAREIAEAIAPQFKESSLEDLTKMVNRYKSVDSWNLDPALTSESFTLLQDVMEQGKELSKRVPYEDMVTVEFANSSIKNIK
jgi:NitT/TauT family transport system substrate-binding protein